MQPSNFPHEPFFVHIPYTIRAILWRVWKEDKGLCVCVGGWGGGGGGGVHGKGFKPADYVFVQLKLPPIVSITILINQKFLIMKILMKFEIVVIEDDSNLSLL